MCKLLSEKRSKSCGISSLTKVLRVRVRLDLQKSLCRWKPISYQGSQLWIKFKYECLPNYGYFCDLLRHLVKACEKIDVEIDEADLPYGPWLKASPLEGKDRATQIEREA